MKLGEKGGIFRPEINRKKRIKRLAKESRKRTPAESTREHFLLSH